jgi:hypothetical protein
MSLRKLVVVMIACLMPGCAETAMIRSEPTGANVFIDDQLAGKTPFPFRVDRGEIRDYNLRIEKAGYEPVGDIITPRIAAGRAVGAFFTVGIVYLFRSPYYMHAQGTYPLSASLVSVREEQRMEQDRILGEALRNLNDLYRTGNLPEEEFNRRRDRLLHPPQ